MWNQGLEVVYAGASSTYRELLSWLNGMYKQEVIDLEIFTQDSATWEGKGNRDLYGVSIAYKAIIFRSCKRHGEDEYDILRFSIPITAADGCVIPTASAYTGHRQWLRIMPRTPK